METRVLWQETRLLTLEGVASESNLGARRDREDARDSKRDAFSTPVWGVH